MWIIIKTYAQWIDAQADLLLLEAEGIPAILGDGMIIQIDPLLSPALGGVKLQVPEVFAAQAMSLLLEKEEKIQIQQKTLKNRFWNVLTIVLFFFSAVIVAVLIILSSSTIEKLHTF